MPLPKSICKGLWELEGLLEKMTSEGEFRGHVTPYSLNKAPVFSAAGTSIQGQEAGTRKEY